MRRGTSVTTLECQRVEAGEVAQLTYRFSVHGQFEPSRWEWSARITPDDRDGILELFDTLYGSSGARGAARHLARKGSQP